MTISPPCKDVFSSAAERYDHILQSIAGMVTNERDRTANLANTAAELWQCLPDINWVGFYVFDPPELVLGPFQGKPANIRIKLGHGVCGSAAMMRKTIVVPDVHVYGNHIECDPETRSEIVVPMFLNGQFLAVLDVDSTIPNRFTDDDRVGLERVAALLTHACQWSYHTLT